MRRAEALPAVFAWLPALRDPALVLGWELARWEYVIRLSRRLRLLGRLAEGVAAAGLLEQVPAQAARHLRAEMHVSRWRTAALRWVLERVGTALSEAPYPRVLLKGAAYLGQELPIAKGRLPSDADILVPLEHLADAQARLLRAGWAEAGMDDHDQRYYREWSHELPPMRHPLHALELDLHHNIVPPVARATVDAAPLLARLQPSIWPGWQVLQPADQLLHSATHLFGDSEARDRLRDLVDLDGLMRHFGRDPAFWLELPERARELGLDEPLALACHFVERWLDTPVPAPARRRIATNGPPAWRRAWLHPLLASALTPSGPDEGPRPGQDLAAQALLVRYHYRRMPLGLLVPHLWHKARKRSAAAVADPPATGQP